MQFTSSHLRLQSSIYCSYCRKGGDKPLSTAGSSKWSNQPKADGDYEEMNRPRANDYQSESSTSTESSPTDQGLIRPDYENQIEIAVQRKEINLEEEEDGRCYETISEVNRKIDETGC